MTASRRDRARAVLLSSFPCDGFATGRVKTIAEEGHFMVLIK